MTIIFEPKKDVYSLGETINLWVTIHSKKDGSAISDAIVQALFEWIEPLPATEAVEPPLSSLGCAIWVINAKSVRK